MVVETQDTTYLFDPLFQSLRSFLPGMRKSPFFLYEGKLYAIEQITENGVYTGKTFLLVSDDYGKNWTRTPMNDCVTSAGFFKHGDGIYVAYTTPFSTWRPWSALKVARVDSQGVLHNPFTLIKTASGIVDVFEGPSPLIVWQDIRFISRINVGIPWSDNPLFEFTKAVFAGHLNVEQMSLDESLIEYGGANNGR